MWGCTLKASLTSLPLEAAKANSGPEQICVCFGSKGGQMRKTYPFKSFSLAASLILVCCLPSAAFAETLRQKIIGTWKLVSWTRTVEGVEAPAFGEGPIGMTIYTQDGYFCSDVMRPNRSMFTKPNPLGGTTEERAAAYAGHIAYCGRFEVNEQERSVLHHVELSWYPNWTGTTQTRFAQLEGDRLIFKFPVAQEGGKQSVGIFTYVRAK